MFDRTRSWWFVSAAVSAAACGCLSAQPGNGNQDAVRAVGAIPLKDWAPDSSLIVPEHHPPKARYAAIDVHAHAYANTPREVAAWVQTMDQVGVQTTVVLSGATGAEFDRLVDLFLKAHPGRFQLYCGLETKGIEAADYPQRAVAELVRCYNKGARGVGELSEKGSGYARGGGQLPRAKRLHPDDPRLSLFWKKCAELKLPVNIHMADHPSAWRPPDNHQERSPSYQRYNQYGHDVPSYAEILAMRDRLMDSQPGTTFIACHFSNQGNDLATLSKVLDRFPNLYVDLSARSYELGRQPRTAAKFLERYQDRVLFGTDMGTDQKMYLSWWRLLETADEYIPGTNWWRHYGLDLPDQALEKIYRSNALKVLNWQPVVSRAQ
ncbi:MAG TPA: amidohydrolase family protein [Candidatus Solibacter sp.]|nr:amidohydrolase family protein [Candidatus Solibacter sp.]